MLYTITNNTNLSLLEPFCQPPARGVPGKSKYIKILGNLCVPPYITCIRAGRVRPGPPPGYPPPRGSIAHMMHAWVTSRWAQSPRNARRSSLFVYQIQLNEWLRASDTNDVRVCVCAHYSMSSALIGHASGHYVHIRHTLAHT